MIGHYTTNKNRKMSQKVYIDQILGPDVKKRFERGDQFELEEDQDSRHRTADNHNKIWRWKARHGLKTWFNGPNPPNMAVIERYFQPLKHFFSNTGHWDRRTLKERAEEGFMKREVLQMPDRIPALPDGDLRTTGY